MMSGWVAPPDESSSAQTEAAYWENQIIHQVRSWLTSADRDLAWIEILNEKTEDEIACLDPDLLLIFRQDFRQAPSLFDLAHGNITTIQTLQSVRDNAPAADGPLFEWIDRLLQVFGKSQWLAVEMLATGEGLVREVHELSESMNMRFLYDTERRLFSIGYNVSEGHLDSAYYDLLASEARLGSFIAIACGDISFEHGFQ